MIHYQLRCTSTAEEHAFDGWFQDSAAFESWPRPGWSNARSAAARRSQRALMAPGDPEEGPPGAQRRGRRRRRPQPPPAAPARRAAPAAAAGPMPAQVRAMLQRCAPRWRSNCDYVGKDFAEEARKIHNGESERRGIYGEASEAEAEALRERASRSPAIPWVPRADA